MSNFVELFLTCGSRTEADKIANVLLEKRLIACAKLLPVDSKYRWRGKIETASELMVLMESTAENFNQVETEIAKLHNYETFVLKQLPISNISSKAKTWLAEETKQR